MRITAKDLRKQLKGAKVYRFDRVDIPVTLLRKLLTHLPGQQAIDILPSETHYTRHGEYWIEDETGKHHQITILINNFRCNLYLPEVKEENVIDLGQYREGKDYRRKGNFCFIHHSTLDSMRGTQDSKKRYGSKWVKLERDSFKLAA